METFYALRYVAGVNLQDRKHADTVGRWASFEDADAERVKKKRPDILEVVTRSTEGN